MLAYALSAGHLGSPDSDGALPYRVIALCFSIKAVPCHCCFDPFSSISNRSLPRSNSASRTTIKSPL
jgi:hypothetical protein